MTKKSWIALGIFCAVATAMMMPSSADAGRRAPVALNAADADFIALREAALRGDMGEAGRISPVRLSSAVLYRILPAVSTAGIGTRG